MRHQIIALLIAISLMGCSSAPRTVPLPLDGVPPAAAPSPAGGAENTLPTTQSAESVPEPAEIPPDHEEEIVKAIKFAAGVVVVVVVVAFWLVVSIAAAAAP